MEVLRVDDPRSFLERAEPLLMADEARHNLILGICGRLIEAPEDYPGFGLWLAEHDGAVVAAALQTPPWNVVVARPASDAAGDALAAALAAEGDFPGVTAALPEGERFVHAWERATGRSSFRRMTQGIYRLTRVLPVAGVPGRMRRAGLADRGLLIEWIRAFHAEALPEGTPENVEGLVDQRLSGSDEGMTIWDDHGPVSLVGYGGPTPNGIRIGPVYTPPELRGKGYATALVAETSAGLLAAGRSFCFLYTNLANPTSNRIYQRIGYEMVCEAAQFGLSPA